MYILMNNEASFISGDAIKMVDQLPAGVWGIAYRPMTKAPYFYKIDDYKTSHGKIYGCAEKNADRIVKAYELEEEKNVGALLSGAKGLGKSLTVRLIVEKLIKKMPIVVVDDYTPMIPSILSDLHDTVVVLDEFEKMLRSGKNEDGGMTAQESLLSVLDGTKSLTHNLYLMTVNETYELDKNLMSRPGRIRYHFRYKNVDADTIKLYCADNLDKNRMKEVDEVIEVLKGSAVVSLDIVSALVKEMNLFPDSSVNEIAEILNIGENRVEGSIAVHALYKGHPLVFKKDCDSLPASGKIEAWVDDFCFIKIKYDYLPYMEKALDVGSYNIQRFNSCYVGTDNGYDQNDEFWKGELDSDGDCYVDFDSAKKTGDLVITAVTIKRETNWMAF